MRWIWTLVTAWALLIGAPAAAEVQLSPDQLRIAASESLRLGDPRRALGYANALLARDAEDRTALLIRARALRDLGQYKPAKASAKAAWDLAQTPDQKYAAALIRAQVLASNGQHGSAQLWLRRAAHIAPEEHLSDIAIRDFKYVRSRNRWLTRFSGSITPDSNINNGSSERSSFLNYKLSEALFGQPVEYQLGGTAVALSGIEYAFGVTTRYRFRETETRAHDAIFTLDARHYTLSEDAKSIAPVITIHPRIAAMAAKKTGWMRT